MDEVEKALLELLEAQATATVTLLALLTTLDDEDRGKLLAAVDLMKPADKGDEALMALR